LNIPLKLPAPSATVDLQMSDGAVIRVRRHGNPRGLRLVLSHGNGLAINAYAPFWVPLLEHFDVVMFDIRNHGENLLHRPEHHSWDSIFRDFEETFLGIERHWGEVPTVGVFHSLSAIAALEHELACGPRWTGLALFDPPIPPPPGHVLLQAEQADVRNHVRRAHRRPRYYDQPEDLAAQLRRKPAFARWHPDGAHLLACHTLRPTHDGRWELRNPRELEARIYGSKPESQLWSRLAQLRTPAVLIAADPHLPEAGPATHTCQALHAEIGIEYEFIPATTHFLQFEAPQWCRETLLRFLARHGLLGNAEINLARA
jgi:pimeloyl-ACP methyl ester carboxylesterase